MLYCCPFRRAYDDCLTIAERLFLDVQECNFWRVELKQGAILRAGLDHLCRHGSLVKSAMRRSTSSHRHYLVGTLLVPDVENGVVCTSTRFILFALLAGVLPGFAQGSDERFIRWDGLPRRMMLVKWLRQCATNSSFDVRDEGGVQPFLLRPLCRGWPALTME